MTRRSEDETGPKMTREEQLETLKKSGASKNWIAPPVHRLLWKIGVDVTPPLFATFAENVAVMGVSSGILWGVFQAISTYLIGQNVSWVLIPFSALFGVCCGIAMALLFAQQRRKYSISVPTSRGT